MKKIKKIMKEHKKEILIAISTAGITSFIFMKYGHKKLPNINVNFSAGINTDYWSLSNENESLSGNLYMKLNDMTIADLGKFGKVLKEKMPEIKINDKINNVSINYQFKK